MYFRIIKQFKERMKLNNKKYISVSKRKEKRVSNPKTFFACGILGNKELKKETVFSVTVRF